MNKKLLLLLVCSMAAVCGFAQIERNFAPRKDLLETRRNLDLRVLDREAERLHERAPLRMSPSSLRATNEETSGNCGANGDNVTWTFDEATGTLTISGTGAMADYEGNKYHPYEEYRLEIKQIVIESGVTTIGMYAFFAYTNLVSVTIPNSITRIGQQAFDTCISLESIVVPESVMIIGAYAFYYTPWYNNQPDGCVYIGKVLYVYKGYMPVHIEIAEGTISISDGAFFLHSYDQKNLITVTIPASVTNIGEQLVFYGCDGLTSIEVANANPSYSSENGVLFNKEKSVLVYFPPGKSGNYTIPDGVKSIANEAFSLCTALTAVSIPSSVENIGYETFNYCINLTSVSINGNGLRTIGWEAFYGCSGLTAVSLPEGLTSIGDRAFTRCTKLTSISVPGSVTNIGVVAFHETQWYNNQPNGAIYINKVLYEYKGSVSGHFTVKEGTVSISGYAFQGCGISSISIPSSVVGIGEAAFACCWGLQSITIPEGVTKIEDYTFYECQSLISVAMGSKVESIGYAAFALCYDLKSITLPINLTSIGEYAFNHCGLTSIVLPKNVKSIGSYAFANSIYIKSLACDAPTPPVLRSQVFSIETMVACTPVVPAASLALYQQAPGWKEFYATEASGNCGKDLKWKLKFNDGTLTIYGTGEMDNYGDWIYASWYAYRTLITQVVIEYGATSIGNDAFCGCSNLKFITIPNSIEHIGDVDFDSCSNLLSIHVAPDNLNYSSEDGVLFNKDKTLLICFPAGKSGNYIIPEGVKNIGDWAFARSNITSVNIGSSVEYIGNYAFNGSNITSVNIGVNVKCIGNYAFRDSNITSVNISASVECIENHAFSGCLSLKSVKVNWEEPISINANVFSYIIRPNVKLIVPEGTVETYLAAPVWQDFNVVDVTGIVETRHATSLPIGYYNMMGQKLSKEPERGAYIILYDNGKAVKVMR